jgi:hypothetical protein
MIHKKHFTKMPLMAASIMIKSQYFLAAYNMAVLDTLLKYRGIERDNFDFKGKNYTNLRLMCVPWQIRLLEFLL